MAFTSIAALIAGGAEAVSATLVLGAVAEVGMAMTVVGAVTGSKDLMKIGGAMGLVGGIGGMVAGMGSTAVDAAASVGGAEAGAAPEMIAGADASMGGSAATADMASGASGIDTSALNGLGDNIDAGGGFNPAAGGDGILGSAMQQPTADAAAAAGGANPATTPIDPVQTPAGTVSPPQAAPAYNAARDSQAANAAQADGGFAGYRTAPTAAQSYWDSMTKWVQDPKNRTVLELGAKLGGGALQGMQQQKMWDEKMGVERDRLKQTSYGSQVGQNRPHGVINGARA